MSFADALGIGVRGVVLRRGDPGYDDARRVWNARVDRAPVAVFRPADADDVAHAVGVAQECGLDLAIRSSGHNAAGYGTAEAGLVIDLGGWNEIAVDPDRALARVGPGATWGEVDRATQAHGLATTGGRISTTAVGGLALGGGHGWLMRSCGLTVDNLRSVDLVLADGRKVTASADENPDLFWGLRGGGGNFGAVICFELALHEVGPFVTGGALFYAVERARDVLRAYRELMSVAPDELAALFNILVAPAAPFIPRGLQGRTVAAIAVCHAGSPEQARRDLAALDAVGPPLLDRTGRMPYGVQQSLFDAAGSFGNSVYGRSGYLIDLDDDIVDIVVENAARITSPLSIVMISPLGGAVARVPSGATAYSHRQHAFSLSIDAVWADRSDSSRHMRWVDLFWSAIGSRTHGVYVNELGDEGPDRIRDAYAPATYRRLAALKADWDPTNTFRLNQNVVPDHLSALPVR
ncbi:MAG: FAD-binding oxidoreductase [Gaiellaceae bacterium]